MLHPGAPIERLGDALCTNENPTSKPGKLQQASMKRLFVAMTRPRELLCFATHARYMPTETAATLRANGWLVTVVAD